MEKIIEIPIEEGLQNNYLAYALSVIVGRYIPDVRDGLKPVHRRILFSMYEKGLRSNQKTRKSAKVVGDVLANYHPHGDQAVYQALVRLAQDFSMRYTLIEGQGNFGSIDGDPAAAMRYTECRMQKLAEELLSDIDKNTVNFIPNYDNTDEEPVVLPAGFPNLLVNGSMGIAVAMSTNIPPHNLSEIIEATKAYIDNKDITVAELYTNYVLGPDFPTGAGIFGLQGIRKAYETGKGTFYIRGKAEIETLKNGREAIIITELPYNVNKAHLIEKIALLAKEDKIKGIGEIRDETNKEGIRVVLEVKRNGAPAIILNQLYLHTQLQVSFSITLLAIVDRKPMILSLKEILAYFVAHQKEVLVRKTEFDLNKAQDRLHIVEGLLKAIDNLDEVVAMIRGSQTAKEAKERLMERFALSEPQTQAILDLRLQKLVGLERLSLEEEHTDLLSKIAYFQSVLASEDKQYSVIKEQLTAIQEKYGDKRKTEILAHILDNDIDIESTIKPEDCTITISNEGMIKRASLEDYRTQRRGGRGKTGANVRGTEEVEHLLISHNLDYLCFFTDKGKVYYLKVYEIPEGSSAARGRSIKSLINMEENEKIQSYLAIKNFSEDEYVLFITSKGIVKKTALSNFVNARKRGINAITLDENDALVTAIKTTGNQEIFIATALGQGLRFNEEEVRPMGRNARGVIGIRLREGNKVIGAAILQEGRSMIAVTSKGYGKRVSFEEFMAHKRGTFGQRYYSTTKKTGHVEALTCSSESSEIMIITKSGIVMRTKISEIREQGKNAQGVRLINIKDKEDLVAAIAVLDEDEEEI